jgi:chromosome partitioning protein
MKIIALVSSKGGVGKSTLAACLAAHAAGQGVSVYLADLDPQQSSAAWWRRRKGPDNPLLIVGTSTVTDAIARITQRNAGRDYLIVDTPGSLVPVIADAISAADAVLVVVQASGKDLEAQGVTERLIDKSCQRGRMLYVLNRCDRRSSLPFDAAAKLRGMSTVVPFLVGERADYVRADMAGKVAPEINNSAAEEIAALWKITKEIADGQNCKAVRSVDGAPRHAGSSRDSGEQGRAARRSEAEKAKP